MESPINSFNEQATLHKLHHYLPAQSPLKDFVHHNTLHAFQDEPFFKAAVKSAAIFGYKTLLSIDEYRGLYADKKINTDVLERIIIQQKGIENLELWTDILVNKTLHYSNSNKIGNLRAYWKKQLHLDLDSLVHINLFRLLSSYLDQGIAVQHFPIPHKGLRSALIEIEQNSFSHIVQSKRARTLLFKASCSIQELLQLIVGDEAYFEQYLFDQQFAHPGWSGLVAAIENKPQMLLDKKSITLHDLIFIELILEIDALDREFGESWKPCSSTASAPLNLFEEVKNTEINDAQQIWQEAYEWTYYDEVLSGIKNQTKKNPSISLPKFQAYFCIDDREISIRQHLELLEPECKTYATPGHFALDTMFQPQDGKFYTQICPAPITPKYLIKEEERNDERKKDVHFRKATHHLLGGWLVSQTIGYWSAIKLVRNIFNPKIESGTAYSYMHMHKHSKLTIENENNHQENGLQVGYTLTEMTDRVENVLKSTGLIIHFSPLVYMIAHGGSSTNNPYYAGYDCGACSGRPGSVNARAFSMMANKEEVRVLLEKRGIKIPQSTQFLGGLHDTTRDEIVFYDEDNLNQSNQDLHKQNDALFKRALENNAKERSRRFMSIDTKTNIKKIHQKVKERSVSLFEPRPELNHSNNTLCIVANRSLTENLFLDQRAFLNSYDYQIDPQGEFLAGILNAATPVCGGINLEYYFSRVDNQKFGSGSKLPHNVVGLIGLANGVEGDLRPGLPIQMVEVHDPLRLLMIIEHKPNVVLEIIQRNPSTYEWYKNDWVNLVVVDPENQQFYVFKNHEFIPYQPLLDKNKKTADLMKAIESTEHNLPVYELI